MWYLGNLVRNIFIFELWNTRFFCFSLKTSKIQLRLDVLILDHFSASDVLIDVLTRKSNKRIYNADAEQTIEN